MEADQHSPHPAFIQMEGESRCINRQKVAKIRIKNELTIENQIVSSLFRASEGTRTLTAISDPQILSLMRLPISPPSQMM